MKVYWFFVLILLIFLDFISGNFFSIFQWFYDSELKHIFFQLRIERVITALVTGGILGFCGLMLQTILNNPLGGPYVLGISTSSAFGIALSLMLVPLINTKLIFVYQFVIAVFFGGLTILFLTHLAYKKSIVTVIIAGILVNGLFSSLINLLQYIAEPTALKRFVVWTMASTDHTSGWQLILLSFISTVIILVLTNKSEALDAIFLADDYAKVMGVNSAALKSKVLFLTGILIILVTLFSGPIAFVGVIAPHLARMFSFSHKHRILIWSSVFFGAIILLFADIISHLSTITLPLNTILSLLGLPILFYLIIIKKQIKF